MKFALRVLLPARWSDDYGQAPDLGPLALTVSVRDSAEHVVEGALGVGFEGLDAIRGSGLDQQLWWKPAAALAPGSYTAELKVSVPSGAAENDTCQNHGFERTIGFTVAAEAAAPATLGVDVTTSLFYTPDLYHGYVCGNEGAASFTGEPGICCSFRWPSTTTGLATDVTFGASGDGGAFYHLLEIEVNGLGDLVDERRYVRHPLEGSTWEDRQTWYPLPNRRPLDERYCATARVVRLHDGAVVASASDCAETLDAAEPGPPPVPVCDPGECAAARERLGPIDEPSVEVVEALEPAEVEATEVEATEVEATEVEAAEVEAAEVVEPADEDAVADPDPVTRTRDGGGCAGGSGSAGGLAAWLALLVRFARGRSRLAAAHR